MHMLECLSSIFSSYARTLFSRIETNMLEHISHILDWLSITIQLKCSYTFLHDIAHLQENPFSNAYLLEKFSPVEAHIMLNMSVIILLAHTIVLNVYRPCCSSYCSQYVCLHTVSSHDSSKRLSPML